MVGNKRLGMEDKTEKKKEDIPEHDCQKNLDCTRAGMFVSYYQCRICGKEFRYCDPLD